MGLFGGLANRLHRKKDDDLDELRQGVLGERFEPEPLGTSPFAQQQPLQPSQRNPYEDFPTQSQRDFGADVALEPPNRENVSFESRSGEGNYEVIDRLRFIENQLSAIRSQTELINERLKNIELKLGRPRY